MKQLSLLFTLLLFLFLNSCSNSVGLVPFGSKVKKEYFTGGKVRSEFIMKDSSGQNGLLRKYGYDGKVTSTVGIRNGVKQGIETWLDKEGRTIMKVPYVNGKKHGIKKAYYPNGDVMISFTYVNGVQHGKAFAYNKDGTINKQAFYRSGKLVN